MGTKHSFTPGPWSVGDTCHDDEQFPETVINALEGRAGVAVALEFSGIKGMREANARLISAAPDLLLALQLIAHATAPSHDDGGFHENAYSLAVEAILKATGEAA